MLSGAAYELRKTSLRGGQQPRRSQTAARHQAQQAGVGAGHWVLKQGGVVIKNKRWSEVRLRRAALQRARPQRPGPGRRGMVAQRSQPTRPAKFSGSCAPHHRPQASPQILSSGSAWHPLHAQAPASTAPRQRPCRVLLGCACAALRRFLRKQEPCAAAPWSGLCPAAAAQQAAVLMCALCSVIWAQRSGCYRNSPGCSKVCSLAVHVGLKHTLKKPWLAFLPVGI